MMGFLILDLTKMCCARDDKRSSVGHMSNRKDGLNWFSELILRYDAVHGGCCDFCC